MTKPTKDQALSIIVSILVIMSLFIDKITGYYKMSYQAIVVIALIIQYRSLFKK